MQPSCSRASCAQPGAAAMALMRTVDACVDLVNSMQGTASYETVAQGQKVMLLELLRQGLSQTDAPALVEKISHGRWPAGVQQELVAATMQAMVPTPAEALPMYIDSGSSPVATPVVVSLRYPIPPSKCAPYIFSKPKRAGQPVAFTPLSEAGAAPPPGAIPRSLPRPDWS